MARMTAGFSAGAILLGGVSSGFAQDKNKEGWVLRAA